MCTVLVRCFINSCVEQQGYNSIMPQGRRKIPFSGKAKKLQLQAKKEQQKAARGKPTAGASHVVMTKEIDSGSDEAQDIVQKLNEQPAAARGKGNPNRYVLQFHRESQTELRERKDTACRSLVPVSEKELEIESDSYFLPDLDIPRRPPWNFDMTREQLEAREHRYFTEYISTIEKKFNWKDLSYFELNIETWRQLWRVLEISDIILVIVDIRFPNLLFPTSLYNFVTTALKKQIILVLNKVDLAPPPLVVAWKCYFEEKYPELHVLIFTSIPGYNLRVNQAYKAGLQQRRRRGKMRMAAEGAQKLMEACQLIVGNEVDLSSWKKKISEEMDDEYDTDDIEVGETVEMSKVDTSYVEHEKYKDGILTIGCVGQPNVGKSSLMNAIMGKKVVSVSKTPGHTKHFQTIYLTSNVRLCDCPGLVFPSKIPKALQILMGSFPIAQLREPFSVVQFLAERIDLPSLLKLQHPEGDDTWSAMDVCEGWALKRGFRTARAARLDAYRAANHILRMALEGKICLCLHPPGYSAKKDYWQSHKDVEMVTWVQAQMKSKACQEAVDSTESSGDEEIEEERGRSDSQSRAEESEKDSESGGETSYPNFQNKFSVLDATE